MSGINAKQLMELVIKPTLKFLELDSPSARQLLACTFAQESWMGHYLKQVKGPALGIGQVEPLTHLDVYENFLIYNPKLRAKIDELSCNKIIFEREKELVTNLAYAAAITRLVYYRIKEPLPEYGDIGAMAVYWKNYYNTSKGKGTIQEFTENYHRLVEGNI